MRKRGLGQAARDEDARAAADERAHDVFGQGGRAGRGARAARD